MLPPPHFVGRTGPQRRRDYPTIRMTTGGRCCRAPPRVAVARCTSFHGDTLWSCSAGRGAHARCRGSRPQTSNSEACANGGPRPRPIAEPVVEHGPFATTTAPILQAMRVLHAIGGGGLVSDCACASTGCVGASLCTAHGPGARGSGSLTWAVRDPFVSRAPNVLDLRLEALDFRLMQPSMMLMVWALSP